MIKVDGTGIGTDNSPEQSRPDTHGNIRRARVDILIGDFRKKG